MAPRKKAEPPESLQRLARVLPVEWRSMFGGIGIYSEGIFFALISSEGPLYFRVDDANRPDFEKAASEPFRPYSRVKSRDRAPITMPYWRVPEKVLEKPATLRKWAEKALEAARAARVKRKGAAKPRPR
ncbi:MAG: Regulator of competence-specific s [Fibrobacteria bacterium]|jgi:DNA transformation protein|nr:Regulator of competence-specific s [Fibrobacteria bacterium]